MFVFAGFASGAIVPLPGTVWNLPVAGSRSTVMTLPLFEVAPALFAPPPPSDDVAVAGAIAHGAMPRAASRASAADILFLIDSAIEFSCSTNDAIPLFLDSRDVNLFVDSLLSNNTDLRIHEGVITPHSVGFAKSVTP